MNPKKRPGQIPKLDTRFKEHAEKFMREHKPIQEMRPEDDKEFGLNQPAPYVRAERVSAEDRKKWAKKK